MSVIAEAVVIGMLVVFAGTIPRNVIFEANLRVWPAIPWAVPVVAAYIWLFWRYLNGEGPPDSTREARRAGLRSTPLPGIVWTWALLAGTLGIAALVLALRLANRVVTLPEQTLAGFENVPPLTVIALLLAAAPVAGIIEESAFRGYMQGPIERKYGLAIAILITGTMFAIAHLDFTLILWPYYVAVAAVYGAVTYLTQSIRPAILLHTGGNLYSNFDLWLHGQAEWQAGAGSRAVVWTTGMDPAFWRAAAALLIAVAATAWAFRQLARARAF
jgi:membrane protease YdiL (CAAX protease family)